MIIFKKYREEPRLICTDDRLKKLRALGFDTDGYRHSMENILRDKGFGLPKYNGDHFNFMVNHKYVRSYLNYSDALAEEILLLHKLKLL